MLHLFEAVGIELEYMLVEVATLDIAPVADWLLTQAAGEITDEFVTDGFAWNNELALHVIEFKLNGPRATLDGLADGFQGEVRRANSLLSGRGLQLLPGGMHPWMDPTQVRLWPHENREVYQAFDRIFSCKGHGWANLQSMHINLPFGDDTEFGQLHAAIRFLLPLMPGLTASSPVMDGVLTGTADNRLAVYRTNCARVPSVTGAVIPEPVFSITEYQRRVLGRIYSDLAPLDPAGVLAEEWVNARGAIPRFGRMAIEIRVLDVQECPAMDLAFARLLVATLRALCEEIWSTGAAVRGWRTEDLARYFDAALARAEATDIHNSRYLAALGMTVSHASMGQVWGHLAESAAARGLLERESEAAIEHYLSHGTLATRLRSSLPSEPDRIDLERVYRGLADCLAEGSPFRSDRHR